MRIYQVRKLVLFSDCIEVHLRSVGELIGDDERVLDVDAATWYSMGAGIGDILVAGTKIGVSLDNLKLYREVIAND